MTAKTRFAISTILSVLLALGIFLVVLMISRQNNHKWDLTRNQRFSLSQQSLDVVRDLKEPVEALAFLAETDDASRQAANELLGNYKLAAPEKFSFQLVDPRKSPLLARKHDVRMPGQVILVSGSQTQRSTAVAEEELTNALLRLSDQAEKKVYFLSGHGERAIEGSDPEALARFQGGLAAEGFKGSALNLLQAKQVPADASVVVLAGPTRQMLPAEQQTLKAWLQNGGRLLATLELETGDHLDWLLKDHGIKSPAEAILDEQAQMFGTEPVYAVALAYAADHPITRNFGLNTLFRLARPVEVNPEATPQGASLLPLAHTGPYAFSVPAADLLGKERVEIRSDRVVRKGSIPLAVAGTFPAGPAPAASPSPQGAAEPSRPEARIVVVGDTDFVSNELFEVLGNKDLAMNMLNWLTESENRITIRPKDEGTQPLLLSQTQTSQIKVLLILAIPLAVMLTGFLMAFRRRG